MGVVATLVMDLLAIPLAKLKFLRPTIIGPEMIGRWALYSLRGKLFHEDVRQTPALKGEKLAALISHYLIGIALAGAYLIVETKAPTFCRMWWVPLAFGIATTVLPWFWLYPSLGLGVIASKVQDRSPYITNSLINHTNFGIGFLVWIVVLRGYIV